MNFSAATIAERTPVGQRQSVESESECSFFSLSLTIIFKLTLIIFSTRQRRSCICSPSRSEWNDY